MKSKTSCFNKTIFKKNFTLYWPIWAAYLLIMLAVIPVSLYQDMQNSANPASSQYIALRNAFEIGANPILIFAFCLIAVMGVFSYLYTAKNTNGIHGLPVSRFELFFTNVFSVFAFLAVAEFLAFVIGVFVGISSGITNIEVLFYLLLFQLGMTFFGAAFAVWIAMFTGHILALPVYFLIANGLYVCVRLVLEEVIIALTYGLDDLWGVDASYVLSPAFYLRSTVAAEIHFNQTLEAWDEITIKGGGIVAGYAIAGILFLIAAYRMYQKRQLETAGDIIAVSFMKPIFRFGLGICGGTTAGWLLSELFYFQTVKYSSERFFIMLVLGLLCNIVGFFAAEMLMQKSFHVFQKRMILQAAGSVAVVAVFMGCIKTDAFGLEKTLPAADEVVLAYANFNYPVKYEGEAVNELLSIHAKILTEKEENLKKYKNSETEFQQGKFRYVLKDGSVFTRKYEIPLENDQENAANRLLAREMNPECLKKYIFGINYEENVYINGYLVLYDEYQNQTEYRLSDEETAEIQDALLKDVEEGNYAKYQLYALERLSGEKDVFVNDLNIQYYNEVGIKRLEDEYYRLPEFRYEKGNGMGAKADASTEEMVVMDLVFDTRVDTDGLYLKFGKGCTNLINCLEKLGIVNETWHLYTYEEYDALEAKKEGK